MKKNLSVILCFAVLTMIGGACASSKNMQVAAKRDLQGTWVLNNVTYQTAANEQFKINLFDDAMISCFDGSVWVLPHNGYGSYTITAANSDCTSGQRNIIWSYDDNTSTFQFKKLVEGEKAKNIAEGYKLTVTNATSTNLTMQSQVNVGGGTLTLNYNFSKQ